MILDGAFAEEAAAEASGANNLERHLRQVVQWIERGSRVKLAAIGIGHDMSPSTGGQRRSPPWRQWWSTSR